MVKLLTLIMWVSRIANNTWAAPLSAHVIQPTELLIHSGLLNDKSLRKVDPCFDDVELS
jgi:hypothetical protein